MSDDFFGHRAVAHPVLRRAIDDVHLKGKYAAAVRASARRFILSDDFAAWTDVAGLPCPSPRVRRKLADVSVTEWDR